MKKRRITDEQLIEAWKRSRNAAEVGREFGESRQYIAYRIMRMRADGTELPPARPAGYILGQSSDRAREIGRLGLTNRKANEASTSKHEQSI